MKRTLVAMIALTLMVGSLARAATPQIANTKHNFNADGYAWADGQICKPCHIPHHANTDNSVSTRLWNHNLTNASQYTLYDGTVNATDNTSSTGFKFGMDRVSRLCLGCHDGTVALDAFGVDPATGLPYGPGGQGTANGGAGQFLATAGHQGARNNLGTDFRDDHPVGLPGWYNGPSYAYLTPLTLTTNSVTGVVSAKVGSLGLVGDNSNVNFYVGCRTCHNPHGAGAVANTPYAYLLNVDNSNSALCLTCHTK